MTAQWQIEENSDPKAGWLQPFIADMSPGEEKYVRRGHDRTVWHVVMNEGFMQAVGSVTATLIAREEDDDAEGEGPVA